MRKQVIALIAVILLCGCLSDDYYVDMVDVEGGTFTMGSDDEDADDDEQPVHSVNINSFRIARYETTQKLWCLVMNDKNPSYFKGKSRPVECVSWYDVQIFIERLNRITGHRYRLPTEAEWEYAALGGIYNTGCKYSGGEIEHVAWFNDNSDNMTHDVGLLQPNELGIYDMNGNVHEWCDDLYDSLSYSDIHRNGPMNDDVRVYRGGSWSSNKKYCRIANRNKYSSDLRHYCLGFRLAEDMD